MKIYVGNLERGVSEDGLRELFENHGSVDTCTIIKDRQTNESRGFGFVEMADMEEAKGAIEALNGTMFNGRTLTVNEAREREPREGGFRSREGGGGGGQRFPRSSEGPRKPAPRRWGDDQPRAGGFRSDRGDRSNRSW